MSDTPESVREAARLLEVQSYRPIIDRMLARYVLLLEAQSKWPEDVRIAPCRECGAVICGTRDGLTHNWGTYCYGCEETTARIYSTEAGALSAHNRAANERAAKPADPPPVDIPGRLDAVARDLALDLESLVTAHGQLMYGIPNRTVQTLRALASDLRRREKS